MLDDNLPSYRFQPSSDSPLHTILYFTQNGSDPAPSYLIMRADPAQAESKNKYAIALTDAASQSIIYGETLVEPIWSQPTLSAAEVRAQNGSPPPNAASIPDTVTLNLYNPDSQVVIRTKSGSWGKSDSYEFELPEQSFKNPSGSALDRDEDSAPVIGELEPRVVFRWKRDSRFSSQMTCYMVGRNVGGRKSKDPDITVAMFKDGRHDTAVTIYEPNLNRVDVQDQKGLEVVLLLSAEIMRDLFLDPRSDPFNIAGAPPVSNGRRRAQSAAPSPAPAGGPSGLGPPQSHAAFAAPSSSSPSTSAAAAAAAAAGAPPTKRTDSAREKEIEAETQRLQAMVEAEERQRREQEARDEAEARRIRDMLNAEENERRRRAAQVDEETERLRRQYGVQGQNFGNGMSSNAGSPTSPTGGAPQRPPRPGHPGTASSHAAGSGGPWLSGGAGGGGVGGGGRPPPPQRPVSCGPQSPATGANMSGGNGWFRPSGGGGGGGGGPSSSGQQQQGNGSGGGKKTSNNPLSGLLGGHGTYGNPAASVSNFFSRRRDSNERTRGMPEGEEGQPGKLSKKRSNHF